MSIDLIHAIQSALTDEVVGQLGTRIGLPPQAARAVISTAAPALLAGLMQKAATLEGARSLFATVVSPQVNGKIGEELPHLTGSTGGVSELENAGRRLLEGSLDRRAETLSDEVAAQTGVPAHATHALTGIVGATLLGVLKQHLFRSRSSVGQLPALLGQQMPLIAPYLNDRLLAALGLGSAATFAGSVLAQLRAVSAHIEHPTPTATPTPEVTAAVQVPADAVVREERRAHGWLWWPLLAIMALAAALVYLFPGGFSKPQRAGRAEAGQAVEHAVAPQAAWGPAGASRPLAAEVAASEVAASMRATVAASAPTAASSEAEEAPQPAAAAAPAKNSQLAFTVGESGRPTLTATLGSEAEKTQLVDELTKRLGPYNFNANVTVDPATKPADWLSQLDGLLPLMSVPGAEVKLDGTHIELSGAAANAKLGWLNTLKSLFGASYEIGTFDVQRAVEEATANFRSAIQALLAPDATCVAADVAKVLNLQVINFASASDHVPASAAEDLNQSARVLHACARNGRPAKLEVAGYSDNVGGEQSNLQLSKHRAEAVRSYLVRTGVPADSLSAQGYGEARPIVSNGTAGGRFANRRIEFVTQQ